MIVSGVSVDHVVSVIVVLAAIVLFIGLFDQTLSSAVDYQHNTLTAKACDNLVDELLLTDSPPLTTAPSWFGLQDSSLAPYNLDPFALMRLDSLPEIPVTYAKTGQTYSAIMTSPDNYLLYPYSDVTSYSTALSSLGLEKSYGFQLSLTPTVNITITETSTTPLALVLNVRGTGFQLANAQINYMLIPVSLSGTYPEFVTSSYQTGTTQANGLGQASVSFPNFYPNPNLTFAFVSYAYLDGVTGVGYYVSTPVGKESIVPFLNPLSTLSVTLADSNDIPTTSSNVDTLSYNSTFILESQNYAFEQTYLGSSNASGSVTSGSGNLPVSISMGSYTPGILILAYKNSNNNGIVMMPWGFSSLGFSLKFGGTPLNQSWVATDMRQVEINGISYQATLSLWSTKTFSTMEGTL
jgi:hypothetical protein